MANFITFNQLKQSVASLLIKINTKANSTDIPTKTSDLENDSNFLTSENEPSFTSSAAFSLTDSDVAYLQHGYVTKGQKEGSILGEHGTAEGYNTTASGSSAHAEGRNTIASGDYSHAEGGSMEASGDYSHAENRDTTASGGLSHAEGDTTTASGYASHAEGRDTIASGYTSHAEGLNTEANHLAQHVFGQFNIIDSSTAAANAKGNYIEIVGNGQNSTNRSNARTLDWSGNEILTGKLTIGINPTNDMDVVTKQYLFSTIQDINSLHITIVNNLPTENIDAHTIYFKSNSSSGNNIYDEYMYINNNWELIGSTQVDLSNYIQTTDLADWAKASNKPTYTATEVGALPDTTVIPAAQINADWDATSGVAQILHKPTIPNVPNWALAASKPTYTATEVGALPSTYTAPVTSVNGQTGEVNLTIPAAQVQSDWNATSGMGVILNKPTIPAATTVTNTLSSGTLIATINGTNVYAPAYTDADGVSY